MDISYIEKATMIIFEMCRQHPEICPHDYHWAWTNTAKREAHYTCSLCGKEMVVEE